MPVKNLRAVNGLAKTNKRILTSPAVSSGEERGLFSRTAAGNRAYPKTCLNELKMFLLMGSFIFSRKRQKKH